MRRQTCRLKRVTKIWTQSKIFLKLLPGLETETKTGHWSISKLEKNFEELRKLKKIIEENNHKTISSNSGQFCRHNVRT